MNQLSTTNSSVGSLAKGWLKFAIRLSNKTSLRGKGHPRHLQRDRIGIEGIHECTCLETARSEGWQQWPEGTGHRPDITLRQRPGRGEWSTSKTSAISWLWQAQKCPPSPIGMNKEQQAFSTNTYQGQPAHPGVTVGSILAKEVVPMAQVTSARRRTLTASPWCFRNCTKESTLRACGAALVHS